MARHSFKELIIEATYDVDTIDSSITNRRSDKAHHEPISEVHCPREIDGQSSAVGYMIFTHHGNLYRKLRVSKKFFRDTREHSKSSLG